MQSTHVDSSTMNSTTALLAEEFFNIRTLHTYIHTYIHTICYIQNHVNTELYYMCIHTYIYAHIYLMSQSRQIEKYKRIYANIACIHTYIHTILTYINTYIPYHTYIPSVHAQCGNIPEVELVLRQGHYLVGHLENRHHRRKATILHTYIHTYIHSLITRYEDNLYIRNSHYISGPWCVRLPEPGVIPRYFQSEINGLTRGVQNSSVELTRWESRTGITY